MSALKNALSSAFANFGEPDSGHDISGKGHDEHTTLSGSAISLTLSNELMNDGFFVTGIIGAIAGQLQYAKVWAIDTIEDMDEQAAIPGQSGEPRGKTERQEVFYTSQLNQLERLIQPLKDIEGWWNAQVYNPNLKLFRRTDAQMQEDVRRSKALKEEKRLASLRIMQQAGAEHDRLTNTARKADLYKQLGAA